VRARILIATDLHKRPGDFTTVKGYVSAVDKVQYDILNFIRQNNVTHFISAGDWYDKGYHETSRLVSDINLDREISKAVNGNAYICVGNHAYLERDSNPEMYIIQPSPRFTLREPVQAFKPIFQAVKDIQIGPLQISLFHFDKENKNYVNERRPETIFHVGIYHDATMVPASIRQTAGYLEPVKTTAIADILRNVDLAVVGHIHSAVGMQQVNIGDKIVPMLIPGAMCVCRNAAVEKHHSVKLPVIDVDDNGNITLAYAEFSTHMEELTFFEKKEKEKINVKSVLQANNEDMPVSFAPSMCLTDMRGYLISKGYTVPTIQTIESIARGELKESDAVLKVKEVLQNARCTTTTD